jgi:hypothetical protein
MLGMCYILCMSISVCIASGAQGGEAPRVGFLGGFSTHGFFVDAFLFLVEELELLINIGH